jgi:hypothetical protein
MVCAAHPRPKMGTLSGDVVRPAPRPWSTLGPRLFKLWSGRAICGGSGRGAEGLPGLSARDAGDERRQSNSRMGFGEAQHLFAALAEGRLLRLPEGQRISLRAPRIKHVAPVVRDREWCPDAITNSLCVKCVRVSRAVNTTEIAATFWRAPAVTRPRCASAAVQEMLLLWVSTSPPPGRPHSEGARAQRGSRVALGGGL